MEPLTSVVFLALYSVTSCRNESGGLSLTPDKTMLLDLTFPTVIGYDRYHHVQIGSLISPAIHMKALQRVVTYDCIITYRGKNS